MGKTGLKLKIVDKIPGVTIKQEKEKSTNIPSDLLYQKKRHICLRGMFCKLH